MLTWGANGQWCKINEQDDLVRGPQRVKTAVWVATSATAGTHLLELTEISSEAPIAAAPAEATQFAKELAIPSGMIEGIKVSDLDVGYVLLYFEERPAEGVSARAIHDASPLVPEE